MYNIHCTLFNRHIYTIQCTMYTVSCTLFSVECTLCKLYDVHYIINHIHCKLFIVQCDYLLYSVRRTLYVDQCKNALLWNNETRHLVPGKSSITGSEIITSSASLMAISHVLCVYIWVLVIMCAWVCMCVCLCMCICVYMGVYGCVCVCVCVCLWMGVCTCIESHDWLTQTTNTTKSRVGATRESYVIGQLIARSSDNRNFQRQYLNFHIVDKKCPLLYVIC